MSRRFRFSGQMLLKLRKRRQDAASQQFSGAGGSVAAIGGRLERLRRVLAVHNQALDEMLTIGADAMNVSLYQQCIGDIRDAIAVESDRLNAAQKHLRRSQGELLEATRQRRTLQVLKDRQAELHAAASRQADVNEHDDLHAAGQAANEATDARQAG